MKFTSIITQLKLKLLSNFPGDPWKNAFWSQEGEDVILHRIFASKDHGFYVDIGAHHPKRFSNTNLFYQRGWTGINIDAMPGSMVPFEKSRPKDINLEIGVAQRYGTLNYYIFNEPALNGFSSNISKARADSSNTYEITNIIKVKVKPLSKILDSYVSEKQNIDFISVDVEGFDLEVLKSNDWAKYRPNFVLAEVLDLEFENFKDDPIVRFMEKQGYSPYAKLVNTIFFKEKNYSV